jgi:hypothetical protein
MRLVLVEWVDSYGCSAPWQDIAGSKAAPLVCRSVGWLLHDNEDCKVVVPHLSNGSHPKPESTGMRRHDHPLSCRQISVFLNGLVTAFRAVVFQRVLEADRYGGKEARCRDVAGRAGNDGNAPSSASSLLVLGASATAVRESPVSQGRHAQIRMLEHRGEIIDAPEYDFSPVADRRLAIASTCAVPQGSAVRSNCCSHEGQRYVNLRVSPSGENATMSAIPTWHAGQGMTDEGYEIG